MKRNRFGHKRAVAVLGSIAAIGGGATAVAATHGSEHARSTTTTDPTVKTAATAKPLASLSAGELAALARARAAIAAAAVSIAKPILERALAAGTISAAEQAQFLASLSATRGPGAGVDGTWTGATGASGVSGPAAPRIGGGPSSAARAVLAAAESAIAAQAATLAKPVLDAAVASGSISAAQEMTLLGVLERGPIGVPGGPGGPGGPAVHGAPSGPPPSA